MSLEHQIQTRFNCGIYNSEKILYPNSWFEQRVDYLKNFMARSINNQTCKDFIWVVYIDKNTPKEHLDKILDIKRTCRPMRIIAKWGGWGSVYPITSEKDFILATRIDSDNALACDAVEILQEEANKHFDSTVIDMRDGIWFCSRKNKGRNHSYKFCTGFVSHLERTDKIVKGVYCEEHTKLNKINPYKAIACPGPMWMFHMHGLQLGRQHDTSDFRYLTEGELKRFNLDYDYLARLKEKHDLQSL